MGGVLVTGACAFRFAACFLLVWLCCGDIARSYDLSARARVEELPVTEAIAQKTFFYNDRMGLSPDGQSVVYALQDPTRYASPRTARYQFLTERGSSTVLQGCDIWIVNAQRAGEARNLTEGRGTNWAPVWSPDGNYVAFFSDRGGTAHLWVWEKASGRLIELSDAMPLSDWDLHPRWTPDSKALLVVALPQGMTIEDEVTRQTGLFRGNPVEGNAGVSADVFVSPSDTSSALHDVDLEKERASRDVSDIAMITVSTGAVRRLVRNVSLTGDIEVSPDGRNVAFFDYKQRGFDPLTRVYDLMVTSLANGETRVLSAGLIMHGENSLSWSPAGHLLSYVVGKFSLKSGRGIVTVVSGECFIVSADSGSPRLATVVSHPRFDGTRAPLWDSDGRSMVLLAENNSIWTISVADGAARQVGRIANRTLRDIISSGEAPGRYWSPDRDSVVVMTIDEETKQSGFWKVKLADGSATRLVETDSRYSRYLGGFLGSPDGETLYYAAESSATPTEIWKTGVSSKQTIQLTRIHQSLKQYRFGKPRLISWRSDDGAELQGALLLPADYEPGRRYPLVVHVYGGESMSRFIYRFGGLEPDVLNWQLLATRGYAVLQPDSVIHVGTPMQDLVKSILPGINKVIALGVADPARIGVFGHSYGGTNALVLVTQSRRFKAAVCYAGYGDLLSHYGEMFEKGDAMWIEWTEQRGDKMGGTPWAYRDRYIENSPFTYLDRVSTPILMIHGANDHPETSIEATFVGLRRLGKVATYVRYAGEGHVIEGYENKIDSTNRILKWFDQYLVAPH
jgi:dipeptidyl aminopeptidase/acylaminoacyl peptidase